MSPSCSCCSTRLGKLIKVEDDGLLFFCVGCLTTIIRERSGKIEHKMLKRIVKYSSFHNLLEHLSSEYELLSYEDKLLAIEEINKFTTWMKKQ